MSSAVLATYVQWLHRRRLGCVALCLSFLAIIVLVLSSLYVYVKVQTANEWAEAEAEADSFDPRWRLHEIEADREKIPEEDNSALHIIAVMPDFRVSDAKPYNHLFSQLPPTVLLNDEQLQLLRVELAKIVKPLEEARRLKDMPRGRFPITYTDDFISTLIPEQQNARLVAEWLQHDCYRLAHEDQHDRAVESCRATINTGRAFGDEPLLISMLIRVAMHMIAMETLERVLAQGQASDEQLRVLQSTLEREIQNGHWLQAIRGERGGNHLLFESIRAGSLHVDEIY